MDEETLKKVLSNPFYCIKIDEMLAMDHKFLVSKEAWVKANVKLINEMGAEKWLNQLLEILQGNYE